jgi:arylsulfatase A-like enzyme
MFRIFDVDRNWSRLIRHGVAIIGLCVLLACWSETKSPNVVYILADDLGWNQVGYHGSAFYETPNIDRIARTGISYSNAYAAAPICSPTRASIMTGKTPTRLHLTDYIPGSPYPYQKLSTPKQTQGLQLEEVTMAEMLKDNGYVTGHFGKWHLNQDKNYVAGRPMDPASQGFDEVLTTVKPKYEADPFKDPHHTIEITKRSINFIKNHKDEQFFAYVSYHAVHRPIMEVPDLVAKYEAKPGSDLPENNPIMGAMIERMDTSIGQILDLLDELDLAENTVVIFYSDNGGFLELQSQVPLRGGKAMIFDGGLRVPLAIRWPGLTKANTESTSLVTSDDFFPTFAEMLDNAPGDIDGVSLMPTFKGESIRKNGALFFHYPHYHHLGYKPAGAVRYGDYKLIEWFEETLLGLEGQVNLYNVATDVGETTDLAAEMPEKVAEMRAMMKAWRQSVDAQEMWINDSPDPARENSRFAE